MRVLVACEYSGRVRQAFRDRGHDAWSCDLLPAEDETHFHIQGDVGPQAYRTDWDLMIAHPPCTHLAVSGAAWFKDKTGEQEKALAFVKSLMDAPIDRICIENPVSIISSRIRPPECIIQPYEFGHLEQKKTCLWLKNLPPLRPTHNVYLEMMKLTKRERERIHYLPPGPDRWKERSRTFEGIAKAMADQWG